MSGRIFVQIPEYRDRDLDATLQDMSDKAEHPGRLQVAVLSQRSLDDPPVDVPARMRGNVEVLTVPAECSRGPNWARRCLQDRYDGQEYSLVIDSHLRFVDRWDTVALRMLEDLRDISAKPMLTGYLPSFVPGHAPDPGRSPYKMAPLAREQGVLTKLTSYPISAWQELRSPLVAEYMSLHFALATGDIVSEVPHDPEVYFFGDEVAYGARAFTCGWDLFHPHRVLGWHAYDRTSRTPHWDDHPRWGTEHRKTLERLRRLYHGDQELSDLLGRSRSLSDYETHIMTPLVTP